MNADPVAAGMAVAVRPARPSDLEALVRSTLGNALESEGLRLDPAVARRALLDLLEDPAKGLAYVAEEDATVVGSLYVTFEWSDWHGAWYWWLQSVFVDPEVRGQGVYTALYRFVQEKARAAGNVRSIRLYVERSNAAALRAYRGHGMHETPYLVFEGSTET